MGRRKQRQQMLSSDPIAIHIASMTHEGRGVGRIDGKAVFVDGALSGEDVTFRYEKKHKSYDEGKVVEIVTPSAQRVDPSCAHFGVCGGCRMQHFAAEAQIDAKQKVLLDDLVHIGKVETKHTLPPLRGPVWGYRRKARLGVKHVDKKERVLVGFREMNKPYLADIRRCEVVDPRIGHRIEELAALVGSLEAFRRIAQIEVAIGDNMPALVFRHLDPLSQGDLDKLTAFAQVNNMAIFLQPGGNDSVHPLWPLEVELTYQLPEWDITIAFLPTDFTQVNGDLNRVMVKRAIELLDLKPEDEVLDLFCGLGNFTLPMARVARRVVGVEGETGLVERAKANAVRNNITNVEFYVADLAKSVEQQAWTKLRPNKILLDPPRLGAVAMLETIAKMQPERIVYVSCDPATLARDAGILVHEHGYVLTNAGVMDMFPHTAHVESIAVFERRKL